MNRKINKVAVLGSGVMGSQIACHFANIGCEVLLLDIAPKELNAAEEAKKLTLDHSAVKNRIVNDALKFAIKMKPAPLYHQSFASRIATGNFDDDMAKIKDCDWIIEVVVENLDIKKIVFENVEKYRTPGTLITSNTSGIPIALMSDGRSDDFKKHFCGTHFFNPPRYLKLLEIISGPETDPDIIDFLMGYGDKFLGKTTVLCKDTPAFIANRVGIYSIMSALKVIDEMGLSVDEVDKLTGPVIGRPKSATFRTMDVVGNDTLIKVANNLYEGLVNDEQREVFQLNDVLKTIEKNGWLGQKSGQGFYKKVKGDSGKSEILSLNLKTLEYEPKQKVKFSTLEQTKAIDNLKDRFKVLIAGKDNAGEFYRKTFFQIFQYVSNRIPDITDELYKIDDAMRAGFGWELGPFETWDAIGLESALEMMKSEGIEPASWIADVANGPHKSFYIIEDGVRKFYDIPSKSYLAIPGLEEFVILDNLRGDKTVWSNTGASLIDIGDGILNLEFQSKMNTLGSDVIQAINKSISIAEESYRGLVIANNGTNFSVGANLALLLMNAIEQEYEEIDMMIATFQNTMMRARYSTVPVIVAPHGMALGGGCELTLHGDRVQAASELYTGLVEFGVGLIPAGGGTKELTLRAAKALEKGDIEVNNYLNAFLNIGMAKVSTSAYEAFDLGILRDGDGVSVNKERQIGDAKTLALELADAGYTQPIMKKDIRVMGNQILGMFYAGANTMHAGNYISEHDVLISKKLAWVMAGGNLSSPTMVSEKYLLDLEREAFLSLCGEKKTLERIQHMLNTGKPLRN